MCFLFLEKGLTMRLRLTLHSWSSCFSFLCAKVREAHINTLDLNKCFWKLTFYSTLELSIWERGSDFEFTNILDRALAQFSTALLCWHLTQEFLNLDYAYLFWVKTASDVGEDPVTLQNAVTIDMFHHTLLFIYHFTRKCNVL